MTSRTRRSRLDRTMDKEIDLHPLPQPMVDESDPFLKKRLAILPVRMADEANQTERSRDTGLQRQFRLAPLTVDLRIIRGVIDGASVEEHTADTEFLQESRQDTSMRLAEPVRVTDF